MNIKLSFNNVVDRMCDLYKAQGISKILKQEYRVHFGTGYVFYLLGAIKDKRVMPDKEAEDSLLIQKCIEEFGD